MSKLIGALTLGIAFGAIAMFVVQKSGTPAETSVAVVRDIVRDIADVPTMTTHVADQHRDEQYQRLQTVEDVVALPTEFMRAEATHAMAGRADSATLQGHIFEADRIADDQQREGLLNILFFRLAEIDPRSALALSRDAGFKGLRSLQYTVWAAWGRKDLPAAIFEAKTQTSSSDANSAAQSLYAAFGYMGNETTDHIEAELGIPPDRATRARYVYRMADGSPADAVAFINALSFSTEQREYVSWLAYYLSMNDAEGALRYAGLFDEQAHSVHYSNILNQIIARANPQLTLDRLLADGGNIGSREMQVATEALAELDVSIAMEYFESTSSQEIKQGFGNVIARKLARENIDDALLWARANDGVEFPYFEFAVLSQLAQDDPERAISVAANSPNVSNRDQLVGVVVGQIAQRDPAAAIVYLDQLAESPEKRQAEQRIASRWVGRDPQAAMDWILTRDDESRALLVQQFISSAVRRDVDVAISMLPKLDDVSQVSARQQIVSHLATNRSAAEAQEFVRQFEGQPGHAQLQASLINGIAQNDSALAKQLADQLPAGAARDQAYTQLVSQRARTDPASAMKWLDQVSDERMRNMASAQLAAQWYRRDSVAAQRWVESMPSGGARDRAIVNIAGQWGAPNAGQQRLIDSISSREMRGQIKLQRAFSLMRTNPAKARELLADSDLTDQQREQFEQMWAQFGLN